MEKVEPIHLTRKKKMAEAYRMGYADGFDVGRTRRDWRSLVLGLGLGLLLGVSGAMWLKAMLWTS